MRVTDCIPAASCRAGVVCKPQTPPLGKTTKKHLLPLSAQLRALCLKLQHRERDLYWINSGESPLASVAAGGLAMLLLPSTASSAGIQDAENAES